jgi:two-component system, NtrC family, nitrogen regulation sensor histidine kinase GlnL
MGTDSPLFPLVGASAVLVALVGILIFAVMKLRKAGSETSAGAERLSEEAFAAATIQAALAGRPAAAGPSAGPAASGMRPAGADTLDAAVLDALPVGVVVADEAGVVRRCTPLAREWLGLAGAGTGHPYRTVLAAWPAIADGLASAYAGDPPSAFAVLTESATAPSARLTVAVTRWTPRTGRGGAVALLSPTIVTAGAPPAEPTATTAAPHRGGQDDAAGLASGLAHELANSLTTVHGYAHLVDRSGLSEADRSALDHITTCSEKMLTTVEAFRALVRPLPISPTTFAPADAVHAALDLARQEAGLPDAVVRLTSTPSGTVHGDRVLLEEAIAAVIRNAMEASAQGPSALPVDVSVAHAPGGGRVEIVVTDRGPGVPEDVRARMFQPFVTDKPGHDGLGLARASQVLRAHPGAAIALAHPASGGLVVTITLPQHA